MKTKTQTQQTTETTPATFKVETMRGMVTEEERYKNGKKIIKTTMNRGRYRISMEVTTKDGQLPKFKRISYNGDWYINLSNPAKGSKNIIDSKIIEVTSAKDMGWWYDYNDAFTEEEQKTLSNRVCYDTLSGKTTHRAIFESLGFKKDFSEFQVSNGIFVTAPDGKEYDYDVDKNEYSPMSYSWAEQLKTIRDEEKEEARKAAVVVPNCVTEETIRLKKFNRAPVTINYYFDKTKTQNKVVTFNHEPLKIELPVITKEGYIYTAVRNPGGSMITIYEIPKKIEDETIDNYTEGATLMAEIDIQHYEACTTIQVNGLNK